MKFRDFLETAPEFSRLTPHDINDFEHIMHVATYPDDYKFFNEGSARHKVYLIIEGEVSVTHHKPTERGSIKLKRLAAGEMFGLLSAITDIKHEASCHAVGQVTVASMPLHAFKLLYSSDTPLALHFQQLITTQLARDYHSLIDLVRGVLFAKNESEILSALSQHNNTAYTGPEKRIGERRQPMH
jgi:signal-transduction protein with cAMP-binding, CBS, and nucleotidyltransferase domain